METNTNNDPVRRIPTRPLLAHIDERTAARAFEDVQPELERIEPADYQPIRIDLMRAVSIGLEVADVARRDRQRFEETFKTFPMHYLTRLEAYALALWQAETQYRRRQLEEESTRTPPQELVERCKELRQELAAAAAYVWRGEPQINQVIDDITRGTGYMDLADDTNRLAELFNAHWQDTRGRCDVTREQVDEAAERAAELLRILSTSQTEEVRSWEEQRRRAWTQLYRAYNAVRAGAQYIYNDNPALQQSYPSLFDYRSKAARA